MFRKIAAATAVSVALFTPTAWSLGLGEIKTESALNQPLKAEIKLLSSKGFDERELRARIASFESYSKFGVSRERFHSLLKFEIKEAKDGSKSIVVTSDESIREPFVNVLIELNWAQGKLLREYTLLLDPPVYNKTQKSISPVAKKPTEVVEPAVELPKVQKTEPETSVTETKAPQEKTAPPKSKEPTKQVEEKATANSSPVRTAVPQFDGASWNVDRGQTLWSIARQVRPDGVSVQQTLAALYRNNPHAFINNDINRLKAGVDLKVPVTANIEQISQASALNDLYSSTRVTSAPLDVRKTVDEAESTSSADQGGRLTLGSVEQDSSQDSSGSSLNSTDGESGANVDELNETIETLKLQNERLKEQLSTSDDASELGLAVADDTLSVLSGGAEVAEEAATEISDGATDEAMEAADAVDTMGVDAVDSTTELSSDDAPVEEPTTVADSNVTDKKPVNTMLANESAQSSESLWMYIGGGILALLALIGGFFAFRNKNGKKSDSGLLPDIETMATASKARDSFLQNESSKREVEVEYDPVGEADIAIARGQLELAETTLLSALVNNESNDEVRVKLMELYAGKQSTAQFNEQRAGLSDDFDYSSELGIKVQSLAANVDSTADDVFDDSITMTEEDIFGHDDGAEDESASVADESSVVEEVDSVALDMDATDTASGDDMLSLDDLGDSNVVNFDGTTLEDLVAESEIKDNADEPMDSEGGLSLVDSEETNTSEAGDNPEAETKLELAKAYIEMGEEDSAKDFLKEVIAEGSSKQAQEAQDMLDTL